MDGLLIVNKPIGITSHDVVNIVRKNLHTKKVGHVGTLDPLAEGVLVVCVNQGTKIASFLENDQKIYECTVRVGISTDTYDTTGNIINIKEKFNLTLKQIDECLQKFLGEIEQVPPIYSALKVKGKKLYQYAREGKEVEIAARKVNVLSIKRVSDIFYEGNYLSFKFVAHVSKGTYIRSLVNDIGVELKIPCCMSALKRIKSGKFHIDNSCSIEDIGKGKIHLVNLIDSLDMEKINIHENEELIKKIKNGMKLSVKIFDSQKDEFALIDEDKLLAIYKYNNDVCPCYKPIRVWL